MRTRFAVHRKWLASVVETIHWVIATFLVKQTGIPRTQAATGTVTLVRRFGSAANLNIHLHALVLDGVYGHPEATSDSGTPDAIPSPPIFHSAVAPSHAALQTLLRKIIARIVRLLTRWVHLVEDAGEMVLRAAPPIRIIWGAAASRRLDLSHRARGACGQEGALPATRPAPFNRQRRSRPGAVRHAHGCRLHAGVRCAANDQQGLELLCRYVTRPAIANERLCIKRTGQVVLRLKTAWRDGTG